VNKNPYYYYHIDQQLAWLRKWKVEEGFMESIAERWSRLLGFNWNRESNSERTTVLWPLIQVHPGKPVLSQRRDLLEQPLDFYEPDVLPAAQPVVSKHYRKTQWFGRLLFYRHGISTPCLTNSVLGSKQNLASVSARWHNNNNNNDNNHNNFYSAVTRRHNRLNSEYVSCIA